jgi:E3 ubiquitin-protein ligase SHPRH
LLNSHLQRARENILDWCNYVNTFDVCITTYTVLQHDLGIARPPPDRPRRTIATYTNIERPRSPLVMVEWYRVIMDEVQMVGGGNTEYALCSVLIMDEIHDYTGRWFL